MSKPKIKGLNMPWRQDKKIKGASFKILKIDDLKTK